MMNRHHAALFLSIYRVLQLLNAVDTYVVYDDVNFSRVVGL